MDDFEDIFEDEFLIDADESDDTFQLNNDWDDDDTEDMPLYPYTEEELLPSDLDDDYWDDEIEYEE